MGEQDHVLYRQCVWAGHLMWCHVTCTVYVGGFNMTLKVYLVLEASFSKFVCKKQWGTILECVDLKWGGCIWMSPCVNCMHIFIRFICSYHNMFPALLWHCKGIYKEVWDLILYQLFDTKLVVAPFFKYFENYFWLKGSKLENVRSFSIRTFFLKLWELLNWMSLGSALHRKI